jgi:flagellar hook-associated protein 1 FlgK
MSFNIALNNAYSGLQANSRLAELVSRNVANATTEGYAAKSLVLGNRIVAADGAGVFVNGVARAEDAFLTADRRRADARAGGEAFTAEALRAIASALAPDDGGNKLADRFAALDAALEAAASEPDSEATRRQALDAATALTRTLNGLADEAGRIRDQADAEIGRQVVQVNDALTRIEDLTARIREATATGKDPTTLMDERDRQIEVVNKIVPVRVQPADYGGVTLYTKNSAILVDQNANLLTLTATSVEINGFDANPLATGGPRVLAGGSLEAAFRVRDEIAPDFMAQLDEIAQDLVDRFSKANVADPSMVDVGNPFEDGLFTLWSAPGSPAEAIRVQSAVLDDSRRLRDGVYTQYDANGVVIGPVGHPDEVAGKRPDAANPAVIESLLDSFRAGYGAETLGITRKVETMTANWEKSAQTAEQTAGFSRAAADTLLDEEMRVTRVDTDEELRNLLEIEKAYAANARVMSVLDDLIKRLLEI